MKKFFVFILIVGIIVLGYFSVTKFLAAQELKNLKDGWYVEIVNEYINIREKPDRYSNSYSKVHKGEVYKVLDINLENKNNFWYHIQIDKKKTGWIANPRTEKYLIDHNNPSDIAIPIIKLSGKEYRVNSIKDISYDHLTLWDDREGYEVTHIVYHEYKAKEDVDQYWIKYTITDKAGKSSSKTEKIFFTITPDEKDVVDFSKYTK